MASFTAWAKAWIVENYISVSLALITVGVSIGWHMRLEDGPEQNPDYFDGQPD